MTQQQSAAEAYVREAQRAGCPPDQISNFLRGGVVLQPKQLEASAAARLCDYPGGPNKVGFGGSRGGGKSHWMLAQMVADDCQRYPGLKCLMLRKVGKALKENFADLLRKALAGVPYSYVPSRNILEMPNGSQVILGHFQSEGDIDAYLGLEYDIIGVEEATTLTSSKHRAIETCNRTSKPGWRPRMYDTTNPGNLGHAWFKALYILPFRLGKETNTRFIPSTVDDNAFINEDYEKILAGLTGWQLRAWRYGDWDIAAGQFFTNFRADIHVVRPREMARSWTFWCALDYGFTHFTVVYLLAKDGDGNVFIVAEHAERGWLPQQHVPAVQAMLGRHGLSVSRLSKFIAGADVFAAKGDGQTIADKYKALGVTLQCANNDRINGAGEILIRLGNDAAKDPKGQPRPIPPRLFIFDTCAGLIQCLPSLQHDPNRPEDVLKVDCDEDGLGGDDCFVAGTLVTTIDGQRPVEQVRRGDLVLTRDGYRPVRAAWQSRRACPVLTVTLSDGRTLTGTANHPVWVENEGWCCIDALRYGIMLSCQTANLHSNPKSLYSTEFRSAGIPTPNALATETISRLMASTSRQVFETFTSRYGNPFTEKFLRGIISTTLTAMHSTMPSTTFNACLPANILSIIALTAASEARSLSGTQAAWLSSMLGLPIGIARKMAARGIVNTQRLLPQTVQPHLISANSAVRPAKQQSSETSVFALASAKPNGGVMRDWITSRSPARNAALPLSATNMTRPGSAPVFVLDIAESGKADTYALHVADCHEYYANGILVKNCYDAFRYGVMDDWRAPLLRQHTPVAPGIALGTFGGSRR